MVVGDLALLPGEFRSLRRQVPFLLVLLLAVFTLVYGLFLTLVLPWTVMEAVFRDSLPVPFAIVLSLFGVGFMSRWCIVQALAFHEHLKSIRSPLPDATALPTVSILVPAYNEEGTIVSAIASLLALDYPAFEIIVVDDGSSDATYVKAKEMEGRHERCSVMVFTQENGGKASALNLAFSHAAGDCMLFVDADSRLAPDALRLLTRRLEDPAVWGVAGQVTIRNRDNLLTRFQAIEYLFGNGGMRTALSRLGLVTVVPGPIGLYRREVLEEVAALEWHDRGGRLPGPLSHATFAEDFELSLTVLALGGRVVYEPAANAYTKCPEDIATLMSQRYRWMRGTWQVYRIYRRHMRAMAWQRHRRLVPLMLALYPIDIFVAPVLNFMFWIFLAMAAASGLSLSLILSWIVSVTILNLMALSVYVFAHDDEFSLLPLTFGLDIYQCLLVNWAWVIAAIDEVRGTGMRWS